MGEYVIKSQNKVTQYITKLLVLETLKKTVRTPGAWVGKKVGGKGGVGL